MLLAEYSAEYAGLLCLAFVVFDSFIGRKIGRRCFVFYSLCPNAYMKDKYKREVNVWKNYKPVSAPSMEKS